MPIVAQIALICGAMEPSLDGVGDYCRRFAAELARSGCRVLVIALRDKFFDTNAKQQRNSPSLVPAVPLGFPSDLLPFLEMQGAADISIPVLRIPAFYSITSRTSIAARAIGWFRPDVISCQYVPYSYSAMGVPWFLPWQLRWLTRQAPLHVMLHEVRERGGSTKSRLRGFLQFQVLRRMALLPGCWDVYVKWLLYASLVRRVRQNVDILPLFGNIPIADQAESLRAAQVLCPEAKRLHLIYFGMAPAAEAANRISAGTGRLHGRGYQVGRVRIRVDRYGVLGPNGPAYVAEALEADDPDRVEPVRTGGLSRLKISQMLTAHVGVSRSPLRLLGKSGSAIAMIEHGMPLWVPNWGDTDELRDVFDADERRLMHGDLAAAAACSRGAPSSRLPKAVSQFLACLPPDLVSRR